MASAKAQSLARQLREDLSIRLSALGAVVGADINGFPTVTLGTLAAGNQCAFIRVEEQQSIQTTALGLPQTSWTPHVIQIVLETSTIAAVPLMTMVNKLALLGEALKHGAKVEVYLTANATAPSVTGIVSTNLVGTFDKLYFPLTATL